MRIYANLYLRRGNKANASAQDKPKKGGEKVRNVNIKGLRMAMAEKDVHSIRELSRKTGVTETTLCGILSGKKSPSHETIGKIIDALDIESTQVGQLFFAP